MMYILFILFHIILSHVIQIPISINTELNNNKLRKEYNNNYNDIITDINNSNISYSFIQYNFSLIPSCLISTKLNIGTPSQEIELIIDTGSRITWVNVNENNKTYTNTKYENDNDEDIEYNNNSKYFNPSKSNSLFRNNNTVSISYHSGNIEVEIVKDLIKQYSSINNNSLYMDIGLYINKNHLITNNIYGILGLASSYDEKYKNLSYILNLRNNKLIEKPNFSIEFNSFLDGKIIIGNIYEFSEDKDGNTYINFINKNEYISNDYYNLISDNQDNNILDNNTKNNNIDFIRNDKKWKYANCYIENNTYYWECGNVNISLSKSSNAFYFPYSAKLIFDTGTNALIFPSKILKSNIYYDNTYNMDYIYN